METKNVKEKD